MICRNCSSSLAEGQAFCDKCGYKTSSESLVSISDRLTKMEAALATWAAGSKEQKYLERETAENVMARVKTWTTLVLFFAGIPATVALLALAVMFGKGALDLRGIASNARQSVGAVLTEAKGVASDTQKTANDARSTSNQVSEEIKATQRRVAELKSQMESRSTDVQKLDTKIKESQSAVAAVEAKVKSQAQQVVQLSQQVKTVETQKYAASVKDAFPKLYGQHFAYGRDGPIPLKVPGELYVALFVVQENNKAPFFDPNKLGETMQSLQTHGYKTFLNTFFLLASTGTANAGLGGFDSGSCGLPGTRLTPPPCILYFSEARKTKADELRNLLAQAQQVPPDRTQYVSPAGLEPAQRELVEKFGLDFIVVLGQQP